MGNQEIQYVLADCSMSLFRNTISWDLKPSYLFRRSRELGFVGISRKALSRGSIIAAAILLFPLSVFVFFRYRVVSVLDKNIGHLYAEVDCFLKKVELGHYDALITSLNPRFLLPVGQNDFQLTFLEFLPGSRLVVLRNSLPVFLARVLSVFPYLRVDTSDFILAASKPATYYTVNNLWRGREPLFKLDEKCRKQLSKLRMELGIPDGADYICIHDRRKITGRDDSELQKHREWTVDDYSREIVDYVEKNNVYAVCMGETTPPKELENSKHHIRYTGTNLKNSRNDILLIAGSSLFFGGSSGLFIVAGVFGVPSILVNMLPISCTSYFTADVTLYKEIVCSASSVSIPLNEAMKTNITTFRTSWEYSDNNLSLHPTPAQKVANALTSFNSRDELYFEAQNRLFDEIFPKAYGKNSTGLIARNY